MNRELVKAQMGTPNGPCIILELLAFYPSEDHSPAAGTTLSSMTPMGPFPGAFMTPPQYTPHLMLPHALAPHQMAPLPPIQPRNVASTSSSGPTHLSSRPAPSLPTPPLVSGFPGNYQSEGSQSGDKKRKPSLDLNPDERKRRKSEHMLQAQSTGAAGTANSRDVIDLTFDDSAAA